MTVASYERDPAKPGGCLFPVVPEIIASTTPATTTPTRPETPPTPRNPRSSNPPEKVLDIPTSFNIVRPGHSITRGQRNVRDNARDVSRATRSGTGTICMTGRSIFAVLKRCWR